ncbi:MAG: Bacterial alpha-2-macroglobulin domain, partial [Candidatus Eremiobacteraeota bacterium]|nr:Bacterial alpha-2-macroglobulin domain [Candidatus Eremiobacteraeota bacterium]
MAVPWKRIALRLDTYSGAPVDFTAYEVDPADVLVAGQPRARPLDTARRTPVARWRFTPPLGLRYTPNEVEVPLQNREGFFVVEARRGDAVQQTWLDLTRVGLLTKESPGGVVLYGADLRSGKALAGMRVTYLVGAAFQYGKTDAHGIARWTGAARPRFALAEWGKSKTFVAFLPQPPVPAALVGVRTERSTVRAGERVHAVGFARKRVGT